ncbi:hypothetical protein RZS08_08140, partial [Arthrospira platensis SPKY1]|nr:hypothetical protein [Arthrospira platensis SPKY1]
TILMGIHYTASMPAINSTTAIVKTGRVWFDNPPKNPNNPNIDADKYVEFLVFSWVYSYLTTGRQYAEPIYQF